MSNNDQRCFGIQNNGKHNLNSCQLKEMGSIKRKLIFGFPRKNSHELVEPVKNKIRSIFRIGLLHGHDSLVLRALGCGVFRNPPSHIARLFHEVMVKEFKNKFRLLLFIIFDDHNARLKHNPEGNYLPFVRDLEIRIFL